MRLLAALFALVLLPAAIGQDRGRRAESSKVDLQVLVVRATKSHTNVPDELKGQAERLREHGFTGFTIEKRLASSTEVGADWTTALAGPYSSRLTPIAREEGKIKYQVRLTKKCDEPKDDAPSPRPREGDGVNPKVRDRSKTRTPRRDNEDTVVANTTLRSSPGSITLFKLAYPDDSKDGLLIAVTAR